VEPTGIAVVTGASRGIGRAVALELAARGFDVVATMRNVEDGKDLAEEASGSLRVQRLDVTDPATIDLPAGLRVLVNNAGIEREYLPVETASVAMWREMFDTNLFGLLEVTQRAIPLLRASGGGVLWNVTSSSILAPMPFYAAYRASKAAVSALGESLRTEVAPFGIRVVEIMPGPIATDMLAGSGRPYEARDVAPYRALAEHAMRTRDAINGLETSTADAARAIADAILDDDGPLRYGCDPMSVGLLDGWRASSDEQFMQGMLRHFTPPAEAAP